MMVRFMDLNGTWVTVNPAHVVELFQTGTLADSQDQAQPLTKIHFVNGFARIVRGDVNSVTQRLEGTA